MRNAFVVAALIVSCAGAASAAPAKPASRAPARPVPYRSVEVRVPTRDGQTLAGTLTLPAGRARPTVVLLLSSATKSDRDASGLHGPYHPFRQIADTLSRNGIATLRLDDRGAGKSTGSIDTMTTMERANDARVALAFLRTRPDVNQRRFGLLGHSEGGLIAEIVAAEDTSVKAVILMASTAQRGRQIIEWEQRYGIQKARITPAMRKRVLDQSMMDWSKKLLTDRWSAYFDKYDPLVNARRVRVPVLILQGTSDVSCPPEEADILNSALRTAGNPDVTLQKFEGLDHAFLRVSGFQNDVAYGDGAYLVSSDALAAIVNWTTKRLR